MATRKNRKERTCGGMVMGIRKDIVREEEEERKMRCMMRIEEGR